MIYAVGVWLSIAANLKSIKLGNFRMGPTKIFYKNRVRSPIYFALQIWLRNDTIFFVAKYLYIKKLAHLSQLSLLTKSVSLRSFLGTLTAEHGYFVPCEKKLHGKIWPRKEAPADRLLYI